jgi:hypothetical protein
MKLNYEYVKRFPEWDCPHCGQHPEEKFEVLDRNTCDLEVGSDDFSKCSDFLFWELLCPCCNKVSYLFELTLLSEANGNVQFIADGCWTVKERTKFVVHSEFLQWEYEHLEDVAFYDVGRADWIGIHRFGPFADFNVGRMQATHLIAAVCKLADEEKSS